MRISDWSSDVCSSDLYEYNGLVVTTTTLHSDQPLAAGTHRIEVETLPSSARPGAPAKLILSIDGKQADEATKPFTVPLTFTATERSEERRVGEGCVSKCKSRGGPNH